MTELTRLTKNDLNAIEHEVRALAGPPPGLDTLRAEGYRENRLVLGALDAITGVGRVMTLLIAETIQAGAALIIGAVFAVLEYWRVFHGASALGQPDNQAALIAFAVVVANVVHPIYALRQLRGKDQHYVTRMTGRGYLESFWRRLTGRPSVEKVDHFHNPTLHIAAAVITWSTVTLAVYDILGPLLSEIATGVFTRPPLLIGMELLMGLGLSIAGVFFLQSAAHEIGVRTLTDQPERLVTVLEQRQAAHAAQVGLLREQVQGRYMAAKLADKSRAALEVQAAPNPTEEDTQPADPVQAN